MKLYRRLNEPITHRLSKSDHIQRIGILVLKFSQIDWVDISLYSNEVLVYEKAGKSVARRSLFELNERLVEIKRARLSFLGEFLSQSLLKSSIFLKIATKEQRLTGRPEVYVCRKFSALCESYESKLHLFS